MASLGDVGRAARAFSPARLPVIDDSLIPHSIGEASLVRPQTGREVFGGANHSNKLGSPVIATIDDLLPGDIVALFRNGVLVDYSGVTVDQAHFYDLDDGEYIATITKGAEAGTWSVVVVGTTVTVTEITGGGGGSGEPMYAFA